MKEIRESRELRITDFILERRMSNVDAHNLARSSIYLAIGVHVYLLEPSEPVCKTITPYSLIYMSGGTMEETLFVECPGHSTKALLCCTR